jgi:hypothetical protein
MVRRGYTYSEGKIEDVCRRGDCRDAGWRQNFSESITAKGAEPTLQVRACAPGHAAFRLSRNSCRPQEPVRRRFLDLANDPCGKASIRCGHRAHRECCLRMINPVFASRSAPSSSLRRRRNFGCLRLWANVLLSLPCPASATTRVGHGAMESCSLDTSGRTAPRPSRRTTHRRPARHRDWCQ